MGNKKNTLKLSPLQENKFLIMLLALFGVILIHPLIIDFIRLRFLILIFMSFIFLAGIYAVSIKKHEFIIALILALPAFTTMWADHFFDIGEIRHAKNIFGMLFMLYMIIKFLKHFFRQTEISREVIFGVLVVYLLLGIMWAHAYSLLEGLHPNSFNLPLTLAELDSFSYVYFSYVTMTTLGYGDISPATDPARSLAMIQAITGQIYLAVLVARLVGINIAQQMVKKE